MAIPRKLVDKVLGRDHHECVIAGPNCTRTATVADHRANRGVGGSTVLDCPENLVAACGICNGAKEDADADTRRDLIARGVRVVKAATNAATRRRCLVTHVTYPDGRVFFLLPNGDRQEVGGHEF